MSQVNRGHLAGLRLALSELDIDGAVAVKLLDLVAQASAAPEQDPVAWLVGKTVWENRSDAVRNADDRMRLVRPLYTHADDGEVDRPRAENAHLQRQLQHMIDQNTPLVPIPGDPKWSRRITIDELQKQLAEAQSAAGSLQDLCRFLAASYCELDELRYTTAKLPDDQISDFLIGKWPVIQGTANQMNIKRISGQPYDQVGALQGIIAMLATAHPSDGVKSDA